MFANRERAASVGSINKRKRQEGEEGAGEKEAFGKSKKTPRSPGGDREELKAEEMEEIKKMMEKGFKGMKEEIMGVKEEIAGGKSEMMEEIRLLKEELKRKEERWEKEKEELHERIRQMEERWEKEERRKRRNNIVISGWATKETERVKKREETEEFLKRGVAEVKVIRCEKVAENKILVELEDMEEKIKIMRGKKRLMEKTETKGVFIDDDLTREERGIQKALRERAREERQKGKKARVGYKKIVIDGVIRRWDERAGKLEDFQ